MNKLIPTAVATVLLWTAFVGAGTAATSVVVPNTLQNAEGNDSNFGPFFSNSVRYQQVFAASQFSSFTGPMKITQIAFRPDGAVTDASLIARFDSVRIDLSTTKSTPSTLSTQFANNVGGDDKTVFDSFVFMNAPVTGASGGPKDFTFKLAVDPFIYDPSQGDLLLDVRAFESGGGISAAFDAQSNSPFTAHVDAASSAATSGGFFASGLVTEFQFAPVPEPSSLTLMVALGSLCALVWGTRRWGRRPPAGA
jgi:hypothetical protein